MEILSKSYLSAAQLKNTISNLDVSAEFKLILEKLANFTIKAGEVVLELGKKIFEIVTMVVKKYKTCRVWRYFGTTSLNANQHHSISWCNACVIPNPHFSHFGIFIGHDGRYKNRTP